jgi:pimeloyl-ACP methyl ester carboxylesterase
MAEVVPALLDALKIETVDLLGWSLGGNVAQTVALRWPARVRRMVIAGSGSGGPGGPPPHPRVAEIAAKLNLARGLAVSVLHRISGRSSCGEWAIMVPAEHSFAIARAAPNAN